VDVDSSTNTLVGRDIDVEATLDYESKHQTSSGTKIRRYLTAVMLDFIIVFYCHRY